MKQVILFLIVFLTLSACGLKKPLKNPDDVFPAEPDCECAVEE
jgi:predicted small lipoprotein YifL